MWLHGYWKFDWRDTFVRVKSIEAATVATTTGPRSALALRRSPSVTPVAADDRVAPVMGAQQVGGATYFTVCAPFSRDDPGQFYYNNTKDGNSTSPWIPFAKHPTWAGNTYTSRPWFQTGLFYYDIKFSGAGVEVVSNEKAADAHGPANCSTRATGSDEGSWLADHTNVGVPDTSTTTMTGVQAEAEAGAQQFTVTRDAKTPSQYPWVKGCRFYATNSLALLDVPGEYFVSSEGLLYFYPPDGAAFAGAAAVSVLDSVMSLTGTTHHSFVNLTFSTARETAVSVTGADSVTFDGCTVSNSGTTCLSISGSNSIVKNSFVSGCGGTGIHVNGGSIKTLVRGNMSVVGNTITDMARIHRTYQPGIAFGGVGSYVANNSITHSPHTAITGGGNDNLFECKVVAHGHVCAHSHARTARALPPPPLGNL